VSSEMMLQMHRPPAPTGKGEVRITLPSKLPPSAVANLKAALAKYPGGTRVALDVRSEGGYQRVETSYQIDPSHDAINAIEKQIGMGNVKILAGV
ncbi:MAG TPA: hypothetical protein VL283_03870, partial [Candidatus Baltobacteraceae bacterium]|nr:hypothetical protein [Candidatus Baltobacteraceae bacterium]